MSEAFIVQSNGPPGVMQLKTVKIKTLGDKDVLIAQKFIGLNFIDCHYRLGDYKSSLPFIPGFEAVGEVREVGSHVTDLKVGDRVGYCTAPSGAYTKQRVLNEKYLIKLPENITYEIAAASLMKGITSHMLLRRAYLAMPDSYVLVHSAAGGIGYFLTQWLKSIKCKVIGSVGREEKKSIAKENGCDLVVNYNEDYVDSVIKFSKNKGVISVLDSLGGNVEKSLSCLRNYGVLVLYGQLGGGVENISLTQMKKKSLYLATPSLFHYKADKFELTMTAAEIFEMIDQNILTPRINKIYKFNDIPQAHKDLQAGKLSCSNLIQV